VAINNKNNADVPEMDGTETPLTVETPSYTNIINPSYEGAQHGILKYAAGNGMQQITVTGLSPNTPYFVYFVLKGTTSSYTKVMVCKFSTTNVEVPTIKLENVSPNVKITSTNTDAHLYYILVNRGSLPSYFNEPFENYVTEDYTKNKATISKTITDMISGGSNQTKITVIEAMIRENDKNQSYFDLYANDAIRKDVQGYISGTLNNDQNSWKKEFASVSANSTQTEALASHMTSGPQYYLLACAQHISMETSEISSYGFKAVSNVQILDDTPPTYDGENPIKPSGLTAKLNGATVTQDQWTSSTVTSYSYSGKFTIYFDKELYYISDGDGSCKAVVMQAPSTTTDELKKIGEAAGVDVINAMSIIGGDAAVVSSGTTSSTGPTISVSTGDTTTAPSKSFTFTFTNFTEGTTISLFKSGKIGNYSGAYTSKTLYLTFNTSLKLEDYANGLKGATTPWPGFTVSWK
jgi:hypothetical protein